MWKATKLIIALTLFASSTPAHAYNWVAIGETQTCADLQKKKGQATVIMVQWIFGFVTGVDATIRPESSPGRVDAQRMSDDIIAMCKSNPQAHITEIAQGIAKAYMNEVEGKSP
jgi:hypothetical protein